MRWRKRSSTSAGELRHTLRSTDALGRLSGDEFVAVVDGAVWDVSARISAIKKRMNRVYTLGSSLGSADGVKRKVSIAAAVGIAVWKAGSTAQDLLRDADAAMYEDKKRMSEAKALLFTAAIGSPGKADR